MPCCLVHHACVLAAFDSLNASLTETLYRLSLSFIRNALLALLLAFFFLVLLAGFRVDKRSVAMESCVFQKTVICMYVCMCVYTHVCVCVCV